MGEHHETICWTALQRSLGSGLWFASGPAGLALVRFGPRGRALSGSSGGAGRSLRGLCAGRSGCRHRYLLHFGNLARRRACSARDRGDCLGRARRWPPGRGGLPGRAPGDNVWRAFCCRGTLRHRRALAGTARVRWSVWPRGDQFFSAGHTLRCGLAGHGGLSRSICHSGLPLAPRSRASTGAPVDLPPRVHRAHKELPVFHVPCRPVTKADGLHGPVFPVARAGTNP